MKKAFLINWQTTLAGVVAAVLNLAQQLPAEIATGAAIPWKSIATSLAIAILGIVATQVGK